MDPELDASNPEFKVWDPELLISEPDTELFESLIRSRCVAPDKETVTVQEILNNPP
jgi:hypothetical protein